MFYNYFFHQDTNDNDKDTIYLKYNCRYLLKDYKQLLHKLTLKLFLNSSEFNSFQSEVIAIFKQVQHEFKFKQIIIEQSNYYGIVSSQETISYYEFIVNLFKQYSQTLEDVVFINLNLNRFVQQSELSIDSEYKIIYSLLSPITSLKSIYIQEQQSWQKSTSKPFTFQINKLLKEETKLFKNFQSFYYSYKDEFTLKKSSTSQKKVTLPFQLELISFFELLHQIESFQSLYLTLEGLQLESHALNKMINEISKLKGLTKLGLDLSNNEIRIEDQLKNLKCLEKISSNLIEFIYIEDQIYNKKQIEQFCQSMKNFKNVKTLQLEGSILKQGQIQLYFDLFKHFNQLNSISINMSEFNMSQEQFYIAFKSLQSISKTIEQLCLIFPSHHVIAVKHTEYMLEFLQSASNNLESLKIVYMNKCLDDGFILFLDELNKLQKLKKLTISFDNKSNYTEESFTLDVNEEKDVSNIFDFKHFTFLKCKNRIQYYEAIMSAILKQQKRQLESFQFEAIESYYYYSRKIEVSDTINKYFTNNMQCLLNQNNLKCLNINYDKLKNFVDAKEIININQQNLQCLKMNITINEEIVNTILNCVNIVELDLKVEFYQNNYFLQSILEKLRFLQKFSITNPNQYRYSSILLDCRHLIGAEYLSEMNLKEFTLVNQKFSNIIKQRKSMICFMKVYEELIQPHLVYSPAHSHWDLYLN